MNKRKLKSLKFARFDRTSFLIGREKGPPIIAIEDKYTFNVKQIDRGMDYWTSDSLYHIARHEVKLTNWLRRNWNNIDFSKGFQKFKLNEDI